MEQCSLVLVYSKLVTEVCSLLSMSVEQISSIENIYDVEGSLVRIVNLMTKFWILQLIVLVVAAASFFEQIFPVAVISGKNHAKFYNHLTSELLYILSKFVPNYQFSIVINSWTLKFRLDVKFRIAHTRCKMYVINVLGLWSSCCRDFRKNSLTGPLPAFIGELTDLMHMYGSQLKITLHYICVYFNQSYILFLEYHKNRGHQCIIWTYPKGAWESYKSPITVRYTILFQWVILNSGIF
jgi:hypothetical protein